MEVFGLTSKSLIKDLTSEIRLPADPLEAASNFIASAPTPMTERAMKKLRETHPAMTAGDDPATREFMG